MLQLSLSLKTTLSAMKSNGIKKGVASLEEII
jgi:hypothetical protein